MTIFNALPFTLTNGTTADATQVMANYNQIVNDGNTNAAHNGANSDITSLTGLTTPLSVSGGGNGMQSLGLAVVMGALSASVSSNNLTVTLNDSSGAALSATNPIVLNTRNTTLTTGSLQSVTLTASPSITVASTNTLGTSNSVPFRIWVTLFYTGTTAVLGVSVQSTQSASAVQIFPLQESGVSSTSAVAAASSAGVIYTASALTSKPFRIIGYLEWNAGLVTAGTWASGPTSIVMFGPGVKKPGETVQTVMGGTQTTQAISAASYTTAVTQAITPSSTINLVKAEANGTVQEDSSLAGGAVTLFRGTTKISSFSAANANASQIRIFINLGVIDSPASTSAQTYTVQVKGDGANACRYPVAPDVTAGYNSSFLGHRRATSLSR